MDPIKADSIPTGIEPMAVRPWAPRPAIAPRTSGALGAALAIESNGSAGCYGGWELVYPAGRPNEHFLFRVRVRWQDVKDGFEAVSAEARWENARGGSIDWAPIRECEVSGGWATLQGVIANLAGAERLVIKLLMRWTPKGRVEWKEPALLPAAPPPPRRLRLGAASSPIPPGPQSLESNRERFVALCRQAGREGIQLLCLPEVILSWRLPGQRPETLAEFAVEAPGPHIEPFCQVAQACRMAISFSVLEREEERVYNTAVLIDGNGQVVAKYRKVHLAVPDEVWNGVTPGEEFPIATLDPVGAPAGDPAHGVRVGMNICMDSSAAESARAVARLGGEVLLLPIMGDHRADRWTRGRPRFDMQRWMMIQQMRAMDNHLYLVAARNEGVGSGIFAPDGAILAMDGGDSPIVWADVDLNDRKRSWTGATFQDICWFERREPAYQVLSGALQPRLDGAGT